MTGDVLEQLLDTAFTLDGPGPVPASRQLLSDAYSEIVALRRELAAATARADDHLAQLADRTRALDTLRVERAAAARARRVELDELTARMEAEKAHHRATRAAAREHYRRNAVYRAAVAPLAEEIRRARAASSASVLAPSQVDTRLALKAMKTIARANDSHDRHQHRAEGPTEHQPERMTA